MNRLLPFIKKEFYHVLRDRRVLLMIFGMPIVQVLLFGFALSTEIKNTKIAVFDQDKTQESAQLLEKINQNRYFDIAENIRSDKEFEQVFKTGEIKVIVNIPRGFSKNINNAEKTDIQLIVD